MTSQQHKRWAGLLNRCWLFSWDLPFQQARYECRNKIFLQESLRVLCRKGNFIPDNQPINTEVNISACLKWFQLLAVLLCRAHSPLKHMMSRNSFGHRGRQELCSSAQLSQSELSHWGAGSHSASSSSRFLGLPGTASKPMSLSRWTSDNLTFPWTLNRKWEGNTRNTTCQCNRKTESAKFQPSVLMEEKPRAQCKLLEHLQCHWVIMCTLKEGIQTVAGEWV